MAINTLKTDVANAGISLNGVSPPTSDSSSTISLALAAGALVSGASGKTLEGRTTSTASGDAALYGKQGSGSGMSQNVAAVVGDAEGGTPEGVGVVALSGGGIGLLAKSVSSYGAYVHTGSSTGDALYASASSTGAAVNGANGMAGGSGIGVKGSATGTGVQGFGGTGVHGQSSGMTGVGVLGEHTGAGYGVKATSTSGVALYAAGATDAVEAHSSGANNSGVWGDDGAGGFGVAGSSNGASLKAGVWGSNSGGGVGVRGSVSAGGYAGYFEGDVHVTGTLTKGAGGFRIDHPLDSANKCLTHAFVESPEMLNVYSGVVELDGRGEAVVHLPMYFEALNGEFRYQLTAIGGPSPDLHVAEEVRECRFGIAGGRPGLRVSWQVTGVRRDPYALVHPLQVEQDKSPAERGLYLHPEAFGLPRDQGIEKGGRPEGRRPGPRAEDTRHA